MNGIKKAIPILKIGKTIFLSKTFKLFNVGTKSSKIIFETRAINESRNKKNKNFNFNNFYLNFINK